MAGRGGLDPGVGVDLSYFMDKSGFSKPMCPDASFGEGLSDWRVMTLRDERGREQLLARVAAGTGLEQTREWHVALFDDHQQSFKSIARWDIHDTHESAHPFRARVDDRDYFYLFPNWRVPAELAALRDLDATKRSLASRAAAIARCGMRVDRDASGHIRYSWKAGAERCTMAGCVN